MAKLCTLWRERGKDGVCVCVCVCVHERTSLTETERRYNLPRSLGSIRFITEVMAAWFSLSHLSFSRKWGEEAEAVQNADGTESHLSRFATSPTSPKYIYFFFFFLLFRAAPVAYGGSQARGQIGAPAASLRHSHRNAGSELHL